MKLQKRNGWAEQTAPQPPPLSQECVQSAPRRSRAGSPRPPIAVATTQSAALQNHNNELVKCIEDLRDKREEINRQILKEDEEKAKIQNDLAVLTKRLSHLNDSIARKVASRNEYDKTISETEAAYLKILESSQTLLTVLKRETITLTKKSAPAV